MSYTLAYTGADIDTILGRAAPDGQLDNDIAAKAPLASPALTGDPTAPTQEEGDGSTKLATTEYADRAAASASVALLPTESAAPSSIASFPDGADSIPVKSFTGSIVPVQNLNGYDNPWPAGGGKNKFDGDTVYASLKTSSGVYTGADTAFNGIQYNIPSALVGQELTFSVNFTAIGSDVTYMRVMANVGGENINGAARSPSNLGVSSVTFTPTSTADYVKITYGSGYGQATVTEVQLEFGSTVTTFAPYSNICPISGWTGANIYRIKMEQGSYSAEGGNVDTSTRIRSNGWIRQTSGAITVTISPSNYEWIVFNADSADGANAASIGSWRNSGATGTVLKQYVKIIVRNKTNPSADITPSEVVVKIEGIDPTVAISFGSTVYAGTITALGGGKWSIQPTYAYMVLTGTESFNTYSSVPNSVSLVLTGLTPNIKASADIISDRYKHQSISADDGINVGSSALYIRDTVNCANATGYKAYLAAQYSAGTPVEILYEPATLPDPIIVNASDLATLLGANTVWTDVGSVTGMTYRADTALYIQKLIGGGGTLQALSMASPSPSLSLGRVGVLAEPEEAEPELTDEEAEQTEEPEQTEEA